MKSSTILYTGLLVLLFFTACNIKPKTKVQLINTTIDSTTTTRNISLNDLIKKYKALDGETIETTGVVYFEFENAAICQDRKYDSKCFWIDLNRDLLINDSLLKEISGQRLVIKGTVDTSSKGHLGAYLGTIKDVYFIKAQ